MSLISEPEPNSFSSLFLDRAFNLPEIEKTNNCLGFRNMQEKLETNLNNYNNI
jgi:hypothetical protein